MEKISIKGHLSMLAANTIWGLMSPIAKIVMMGGIVSPLVVTDLRIFGAMVMFWIVSLFMKPEHVAPRDLARLFGASLLAIVFNQGSFIFGVSLTSPGDASIITTSVFARFWRSTMMIVGIPVPKKMFAGRPIIASMWFCSMRFLRIVPSSPPRNSTPCGRTIVIMPSGFRWYRSCRRKA